MVEFVGDQYILNVLSIIIDRYSAKGEYHAGSETFSN